MNGLQEEQQQSTQQRRAVAQAQGRRIRRPLISDAYTRSSISSDLDLGRMHPDGPLKLHMYLVPPPYGDATVRPSLFCKWYFFFFFAILSVLAGGISFVCWFCQPVQIDKRSPPL